MRIFAGVDIGTQGSKCGLYREDGSCIVTTYAEHKFNNLRPGWIEMDPQQILEAAVSTLQQATLAAGAEAQKIEAISLSGILCGPVFIDARWQPVRPIIPYLDVRASEEVAWLANEIEPLWQTESANTVLDTFVMPAVYEWVRRHEPDVYSRIEKIVSLAPYIGGCLAGLNADQAYMDPSHLSGWIIGWDAENAQVSERQFANLKIPLEHAPRVCAPHEIIGQLTPEMARKTGVPSGTPLCAGAGDVMQSNLGAGLTRPGLATDVAGTASILTVGVSAPAAKITAQPGMLYSLGTLPGQSLYWGYVKAGGLSLRWFRDELLGRQEDDALYAEFDALAAVIAPGSEGVLFTPYLSGGNADNPAASGSWLGMTVNTRSATLWRAMLESIAFEYADFLDIFSQNYISVSSVLATGGGARSALWNQIKADAIGISWQVPSRDDGAILANAALAGYAVSQFTDLAETIESWVDTGQVFAPDCASTARYADVRNVRRQLLQGPLPDLFNSIAPLREETS